MGDAMNRDELEVLASSTAKKTVTELFRTLGVDVSDQGIFQMQADFLHLRRWRLIVERSTTWVLLSTITLVVGGLGTAVVMALRAGAAVAPH
jgi:hypothetical protein